MILRLHVAIFLSQSYGLFSTLYFPIEGTRPLLLVAPSLIPLLSSILSGCLLMTFPFILQFQPVFY